MYWYLADSFVLACTHPQLRSSPFLAVQDTLVAIYNDLDSVESCFKAYPSQISGVIVESIAANMGIVPPQAGFLERLRAMTKRDGALLVFDEVATGFRVGHAGAQGLYNVYPDIPCLGKIIGGGTHLWVPMAQTSPLWRPVTLMVHVPSWHSIWESHHHDGQS